MFEMSTASERLREIAADFIESEKEPGTRATSWAPTADGGAYICFSDGTKERFSRGSLQMDF